MEELEQKIKAALEPINEMLATHGGSANFVSLDGKKLLVAMKGACGHCPHAIATIKGYIEAQLREQVDPEITVEPA